MNDGLGGLEDGGRDEKVGEGLKGDAQKQQRQGGKGKMGKLQLAVLEARKGLEGKPHCHQRHETANHPLTVSQYPAVRNGKLDFVSDAHDRQQNSASKPTKNDGEGSGCRKVRLVDGVSDGGFKPNFSGFALQRFTGCLIEFVQKLLKGDIVQASKPSDRLSRTCRTTATPETILVKDFASGWILCHNFRQQHLRRHKPRI
jgi:hypothetical protein